jgi:hypothetical protein
VCGGGFGARAAGGQRAWLMMSRRRGPEVKVERPQRSEDERP